MEFKTTFRLIGHTRVRNYYYLDNKRVSFKEFNRQNNLAIISNKITLLSDIRYNKNKNRYTEIFYYE